METRIFETAAGIPEGAWNALAANVWETREWFIANERYATETRFAYFAGYRSGSLRALLPVFDRAGDVYIGPARLLFPTPTRIAAGLKFAIVGTPLSFTSGVIGEAAFIEPLLDLAVARARTWSADIIALPFCRTPPDLGRFATRTSAVDYDLELPGRTFDDYLASLSRRRRGEVRREIRAARAVRFEDVSLAGHEGLVAEFRRLSARRHGNVAELDSTFYERLAEAMGERSRVILAISEDRCGAAVGPGAEAGISTAAGRIIGASSYLQHANSLGVFHGGAVREHFAYFNLTFYETIRRAYESKASHINFRPAADEAKTLRGCTPVRTTACFEPISARGRVAVKALAPLLDSRRWIRRRVRRVSHRSPLRAGGASRLAKGSEDVPGSRS